MKYEEKICAIQKILKSVSKRKVQDVKLLATGIYFKLRLKVSFRTLPVFTGWKNYHWSNFRYWMQKLRKIGKLEEVEKIARSD